MREKFGQYDEYTLENTVLVYRIYVGSENWIT